MELSKNIFFNTDKLIENSSVKISYTGSFFDDGSEEVFIHYGFGTYWDNLSEIKMEKTDMQEKRITVCGGGLAGCEAAWQIAQRGIKVRLYEMKPKKFTPAHAKNGFAELVCSNSLRSDRLTNAVGLLKEELMRLDSLIMEAAYATRVPAGSALAVNRDDFSAYVTEKIRNHPNIESEFHSYGNLVDDH